VQILSDLGAEWMALIAPHRTLELEISASVHVGVRPVPVVGYLLTDVLLLCRSLRAGKAKPWLLAPLDSMLVNQPVDDDALSLAEQGAERGAEQGAERGAERGAEPGAPIAFGVPPPDGPERERLVNLRVPPDEELWLELPDESVTFAFTDKLSSLKEAAARRVGGGGDSPRADAVMQLASRLKDKRDRKLGAARQAGLGRPSRNDSRFSRQDRSTRGTDSSNGRETSGFTPRASVSACANRALARRSVVDRLRGRFSAVGN
jgi:hypothetical protein